MIGTLAATVIAQQAPPSALLVAQKLGLLLARTGGLCAMAPLAPEILPLTVRTMLALVLCGTLYSATPAAVPGNFLFQLIAEVSVGLCAALLCRIPLAAIEAGLQITSVSAGLGIASLLDPSSDEEVHAVTELFLYGALVLFFVGGGHHLLILALHETFTLVPPGAARLNLDTAALALHLGTVLFATVVQVAAPVMLVALAMNLALALVSRAAPAVNIFSVSLVAVLLTGLLALIRGLPLLSVHLRGIIPRSAELFLLGAGR